jgi:hypothetical protein
MKYWHFAATLLLLVTSTTPLAHAGPTSVKNANLPAYQEKGARDVSENAWSSWQAPVSTVDPSQLVSTDSTASNGVVGARFSSGRGASYQFANSFSDGKPIHVEKSKPIQEVTGNPSPVADQPEPVVAAAAPKSGSKHLLLVTFASVAILAYRKFRRAKAGPYPRKPSFL